MEPENGCPFGAGKGGDGNRQLQRRCSREGRTRVPRGAGSRCQVLDVDPLVLPKRCASCCTVPLQRHVVARRAHHRRGGAGGAEHVTNGGAAAAAVATDGDHLDRGLAWAAATTRSWKCRCPSGLSASVREPTRTITRLVPGAAMPATTPYESWYGAGCSIAGGGSGAVSTAAPYRSPRADTRPSRPRCLLRRGRGARRPDAARAGCWWLEKIPMAAASSPRRTTWPGASGFTRR